jgi:hypothetical protein
MIALQLDPAYGTVALPGSSAPMDITDVEQFKANVVRLIEQDQLADARILANRATQTHSRQEVPWVMLALVCEVQQDWSSAREALEQVMRLQSPAISAGVYFHYVRVLRCLGESIMAKAILIEACTLWPEDPHLQEEVQSLGPLSPARQDVAV